MNRNKVEELLRYHTKNKVFKRVVMSRFKGGERFSLYDFKDLSDLMAQKVMYYELCRMVENGEISKTDEFMPTEGKGRGPLIYLMMGPDQPSEIESVSSTIPKSVKEIDESIPDEVLDMDSAEIGKHIINAINSYREVAISSISQAESEALELERRKFQNQISDLEKQISSITTDLSNAKTEKQFMLSELEKESAKTEEVRSNLNSEIIRIKKEHADDITKMKEQYHILAKENIELLRKNGYKSQTIRQSFLSRNQLENNPRLLKDGQIISPDEAVKIFKS